jgi:hypothetical protein
MDLAYSAIAGLQQTAEGVTGGCAESEGDVAPSIPRSLSEHPFTSCNHVEGRSLKANHDDPRK